MPAGMVFGRPSVSGRPLRYWVFGDASPTTLILSGIHGDERTPTELGHRLVEWLARSPFPIATGRIVIAPDVNPDGYAAHRRINDRGVDLNRNYPARNWRPHPRHGVAPDSEPETQFVKWLMNKFAPSVIVSVHAPLACVNYDGPAEALAEVMSAACVLPVRSSVGYPTPGSFGSYAGIDLGIPTITLELASRRRLEPDFSKCLDAILAAHAWNCRVEATASAAP